jgi:3-oxoacyl-[acyl-carrier protein] reductase
MPRALGLRAGRRWPAATAVATCAPARRQFDMAELTTPGVAGGAMRRWAATRSVRACATAGGYDKATMAEDVDQLTTLFDQAAASPAAWHFAFHVKRDFPELLVTGREGPSAARSPAPGTGYPRRTPRTSPRNSARSCAHREPGRPRPARHFHRCPLTSLAADADAFHSEQSCRARRALDHARPLAGKVALVTGASRGIGRAIAERLGRDGATVVVTYVGNAGAAEQVAAAIRGEGAAGAEAMQLDLRDTASVRALFDAVLGRFGRLDILVNNAAGVNVFAPTADLTEAEYDSMFQVTRGVYFALQQAARRMADGGRIVSVSTGGTVGSSPGGGAYTGSKAAIEQFTMALAKELGARGVTVNTVLPGVTQTDGLVLSDAVVAQMVAQTPLGRLGAPRDVADAVGFLVSDDARWITGHHLRVAGGLI